jgi:hypothetical protein
MDDDNLDQLLDIFPKDGTKLKFEKICELSESFSPNDDAVRDGIFQLVSKYVRTLYR